MSPIKSTVCHLFDLWKVFLKESFYLIEYVLLAPGQNFSTSMKYKDLCRDQDIDISPEFVSCQYMREFPDEFQMVVHASLS